MKYKSLDHKQACEFFGVPDRQPAPQWKPYAVQCTSIEVLVQRGRYMERIILFGGGMRCGQCDYGIDITPDGEVCPKCGFAGPVDIESRACTFGS